MSSSSSSGGTVRVAVVGAGGIARSVHLPSLKEMPDVELVAICDLVPGTATSREMGHPENVHPDARNVRQRKN